MGLFQSMNELDLFHHRIQKLTKKFLGGDSMNKPSSAPVSAQPPCQAPVPDAQYTAAMETAVELISLQKSLGLSLTIHDKDLNKISGQFNNMADLLRNPVFISRLTQDLYVSDNEGTTWFKLTLRNGRLVSIRLILTMKLNWLRIINKTYHDFDFFVVGYSPGHKDVKSNNSVSASIDATTGFPSSDFTPEKITKHFPQLVGQTANNTKEVGRLLCHMLSQHLINPKSDSLEYYGYKQGFSKNLNGQMRFNPASLFPVEILKYMPKSFTARQYPRAISVIGGEDMTTKLAPMFAGQKALQLLLLFRAASWHQTFFAKKNVYADNTLIVKSSATIPGNLPVALLKNTCYDSRDVPPIGPNIKPLRFDLESVNDGMVVAIDVFAADQVKKAEKGYDLIINDASGAGRDDEAVHHITALVSGYADLYFPRDKCCVFDFGDTAVEYSVESYKTALTKFDLYHVLRTESGCINGNFIKVFNGYIDEIRKNIPCSIPSSKSNIYIMLITALRIYNEWYSPLFCPEIEQYIADWLSSQAQDRQPLNNLICSEYGKILNRRLADGYYRLILKEETTQIDKGSHTIVVDRDERRIYVVTADSFDIAKNEMTSVADTDSLTAALYSGGYLPHNAKDEKSIRIAAITSDGIPYPLYVHAISYKLLTQENKQRLELLDKEANLFKYEEIPSEGFLPFIKTVDGRFAGKMLRYAAEESNIYFGTGRTGSGKSWAIAQILPMLLMLGHVVVVFDVSNSFTKEKLLKMLPAEVVEKLFQFINVGAGKDPVPVDLGSLRGCESLPDKKRAIYSVLRAATGSIDKSISRKLKGFLSDYLTDIEYSVDLNELCFELEKAGPFGADVSDRIESVLADLREVGSEEQTWDDLFLQGRKIIVIDLGNEVGESTHQLLDMMVGSLFNWQMSHDSGFLSIAIDELIDQDFSTGSPLQTIVKQGRKIHTALIGATQDYYNQGSSHLDAMKQANIKSFCRPGKSEDRVAQKLGYSSAADAGFNTFKAGDTIDEFDGYNKETGENEPITLKGRVVDFVETPLYDKFKELYGC